MGVAQIAIAYYGIAIALHWVVPALHAVKSVQKGQRREGQVLQEARDSIGEWRRCAMAVGGWEAGRGRQEGGRTQGLVRGCQCIHCGPLTSAAVPILVKAGAFWLVDQLYGRGWGKLYGGAPTSIGEVSRAHASCASLC